MALEPTERNELPIPELPLELPGRYGRSTPIGRGALGVVSSVEDVVLDRKVARKELVGASSNADVVRFVREARVTAALEHPGIAPVHEMGTGQNGRLYYTMRRVEGRTLKDVMRAAKTPSERLALLPHLIALAQTLAYAHDRGIVHRDIKPANVMVGSFGETQRQTER